jgi:ATP phosphoribosyltransferase
VAISGAQTSGAGRVGEADSARADSIVDVVSTGSTLKANDLVEVEEIMQISSRLVVNQASLKTRLRELAPLLRALERAVGSGTAAGVPS